MVSTMLPTTKNDTFAPAATRLSSMVGVTVDGPSSTVSAKWPLVAHSYASCAHGVGAAAAGDGVCECGRAGGTRVGGGGGRARNA